MGDHLEAAHSPLALTKPDLRFEALALPLDIIVQPQLSSGSRQHGTARLAAAAAVVDGVAIGDDE
jgi:hypothetical protein